MTFGGFTAIIESMSSTFMDKLKARWNQTGRFLCVGLDPNPAKLPKPFSKSADHFFDFNKQIIDATHNWVCAYKPQIAYYSAFGKEDQLQETIDYIHNNYPEIPIILDAKRGDIGSTAEMYAIEAFERYKADAVTVNPYMGGETLEPFTDYKDKGVIVLCRTSNPASGELQEFSGEEKLFQRVARLASGEWNRHGNMSIVVGATHPEDLRDIRKLAPEIPFLVPGIGAQGGDLASVVRNGVNSNHQGLIISSSRGVIFASSEDNFAEAAAEVCENVQKQIQEALV